MRTLEDLKGETPFAKLWCGPTAVARITGWTYAKAVDAIREAGKARGHTYRPAMTTAYWQDLLTALGHTVDWRETVQRTPLSRSRYRCPSVSTWTRFAAPGLWLVRVTGHFAILQITRTDRGRKVATIFDNCVQGLEVPGQAKGSRSVFSTRSTLTHAVHLSP